MTNAIVLTMDEELTQFDPGAVAISGDAILAVGTDHELRQAYTAGQVIDCEGKVVMPGLVNAHTHVPMTLLRGLADDLRLDVWLMGYMMPVEREFVSPDFVNLGTQLACVEMIRNGITCFADMYYFEEQVARAASQAGLRALCSQTVLKFPTPDAQSYEESLAEAREFIQRWKDHPLTLLTPARMISCALPLNWRLNSISLCTPTSPRRKQKSKIHVPSTACRSYPTSKSTTCLRPRYWLHTACI